ncbi:hypothetical protein NLI96_g2836 [Meripilus lineatus]|uniref:Uncharacterized protein n=1 Tax=Meripilus lineatus TaxID=2056292 RepID=A0AAD5VA39_9APHY|nr:hypothetical protein NLI96_g2836 [Physisporinus lineatus]
MDPAAQPSGSVQQTVAVVSGGETKSSLAPGTSLPAGAAPSAGTGAGDATQNDGSSAKLNVSKAFPEVRGHTSYLTFAVLLPGFAHEMTEKASVVMPEDAAAMEGVQSVK